MLHRFSILNVPYFWLGRRKSTTIHSFQKGSTNNLCPEWQKKETHQIDSAQHFGDILYFSVKSIGTWLSSLFKFSVKIVFISLCFQLFCRPLEPWSPLSLGQNIHQKQLIYNLTAWLVTTCHAVISQIGYFRTFDVEGQKEQT